MLEFRTYEPDDLGACLDLLQKGLDSGYTAERFRWLHEQGPWGPSHIALCLSGKTVAGIYSVIPKLLSSNGGQYLGGRDVDPVVDPAFRGQGIFGRLLEFGTAQFSEIDIYFNFANPRSIGGFRRAGWHLVRHMPDWTCQLGYRRLVSLDFAVWALGRLFRPTGAGSQARELGADEAAAVLTDEPQPVISSRLGVPRTAAYLTWRYLNHPFHTYRYFRAEGPDGGFSLAICREEPQQNRLLVIDMANFGHSLRMADWFAPWQRQFPFSRVVAWDSLPVGRYQGFIMNPIGRRTGLPFLVRTRGSQLSAVRVTDSNSWFICRGDLEIL